MWLPLIADSFLDVGPRIDGRGMGEVFTAVDEQTSQCVALKVFARHWSQRARETFEQELCVLQRVKHPSLARVVSFGLTTDERCYVTTPWYDGQPLSRLLDVSPIPERRDALAVLRSVAGALDALHDAGLVHRTIGPDKILVPSDPGAPIVLTGAGASSMLMGMDAAMLARFTGAATSPTTVDYVAPESDRVSSDARVDVYALAVLAFRMLVGQLPFPPRDNVVTAIVDRQSGPPARLDDVIAAGLSPAVRDALARGLATDPHDRYWRASELVHDLESALGHEARATLRPPPPPAMDGEAEEGRISLSSAPPPPRASSSRVTAAGLRRRHARSAMPSHSVACIRTRLPSDPPPLPAPSIPHPASSPPSVAPLPGWSPTITLGLASALLTVMIAVILIASLVH